MLSTRLLNPTLADVEEAIRATCVLVNTETKNHCERLNATCDNPAIWIQAWMHTLQHKAAGLLQTSGMVGEGVDAGRVAAISVAWFTRLDGTKVVRIFGKYAKHTAGGVVEYPCNVSPEYQEQIIANGGFCVLCAERLAMAFSYFLRVGDEKPAFAAVVASPGDLEAWKLACDEFDGINPAVADDLRKCIGAAK